MLYVKDTGNSKEPGRIWIGVNPLHVSLTNRDFFLDPASLELTDSPESIDNTSSHRVVHEIVKGEIRVCTLHCNCGFA